MHWSVLAAGGLAFGALCAEAAFAIAPGVAQHNKTFLPGRLTVAKGTVVEITNNDPYIHHVYIESPRFNYDSGDHRPGKAIAIAFDEIGDFTVRCAIHLKMQLLVSVK